ncbi:MAG: 50S ribosomal protein L28 [Deltaproteobacteria bacterium]|nr:50S ribosomal protein L28 [Deltaproteobacteria bacterium]
MASKCAVCGKGPGYGNTVSHAHNKNRRRWNPNLQAVRIVQNGKTLKASVCARCIRSGSITKAA